MTDHPIRLFPNDAAIRSIGERLLACTLPKAEWTHEAHLAACAWLVIERPGIRLEHELPGIIRCYNESVGGVNDDTQGYHETITQGSIIGVRAFLAGYPADATLVEKINALLRAPPGRRDWLLGFYSRERLFSVAARRGWVEPDRAPLPSV